MPTTPLLFLRMPSKSTARSTSAYDSALLGTAPLILAMPHPRHSRPGFYAAPRHCYFPVSCASCRTSASPTSP
jgi:hypothetical protein